MRISDWSSDVCSSDLMFAAGLTIALPVGFVLILVQMIMGVIGRSAPAMNLFAVGLPATLLAGVVLLGMATPVMAETLARFLSDALDMARLIAARSEEHTSELQSLMRISYAVFCLKKKKQTTVEI